MYLSRESAVASWLGHVRGGAFVIDSCGCEEVVDGTVGCLRGHRLATAVQACAPRGRQYCPALSEFAAVLTVRMSENGNVLRRGNL
jgi:hypothetical protein